MAEAGFTLEAANRVELPETRYARACKVVAERAPLRILPDELIVGSATLLEAPRHQIPLLLESSVSHTTIGFHKVLESGYRGLRRQIAARRKRGDLDARGIELLDAMEACLDAAGIWHRRHVAALTEMAAKAGGHERDRVERQLVPLNPVQGADRHDVGGMVEVILSPGRGREELVVHPEMAHPRRASVSAQHRLSGER